MSGVNLILLGAGPLYNGLLTVGFASGFYGYLTDLGGAGAMAPAGAFRGKSIRRLCSLPSTHDLTLWLVGSSGMSQSMFSGIRILDGTGVVRTYLTSAATYTVGSDTSWTWGTGSNPVYNSGGATTNRTVEIF